MASDLISGITIRQVNKNESIPYDLLLLADPSKELVDKYLKTAEVYLALTDNKIIGVYVLYPLNKEVIEIKNISVDDDYQNKGVGKIMLRMRQSKRKKKVLQQ